MSLYQRFIESASSNRSASLSRSSSQSAASSSILLSQAHLATAANSSHHQRSHNQPTTTAVKETTFSKMMAPLSSSASHLAAGLGAHISTPISKHQYRRLVEADHQLQRQRHEQMLLLEAQRQQQQQQGCHRQQSASWCPDCQRQQQQQQQQQVVPQQVLLERLFRTEDPMLMEWLKAIRFETELECLSALQPNTLSQDEHLAAALSIRNAQITVHSMRQESSLIIDQIDELIEELPLKFHSIGQFYLRFSSIWTRLMTQTAAQTANSNHRQNTITLSSITNQNNLTITNCTPKKVPLNQLQDSQKSQTHRTLDKLALQIRQICIDYAQLLNHYQESQQHEPPAIDNGHLEAALRKLKEHYGKFIEISIWAECDYIVKYLQYDFAQNSLSKRLSSGQLSRSTSSSTNGGSSSFVGAPAKPYEATKQQLPFKWALMALCCLTENDSYICRLLTEKCQFGSSESTASSTASSSRSSSRVPSPLGNQRPPVARRLDYSTKYDSNHQNREADQHSLRSDYQKLCQLSNRSNIENRGALSSELRNKQTPKQVSTIELLIDLIISQPNRHERLDMMNFIHAQAQNERPLIDVTEWEESFTEAIYTSNQFKVAALRILRHLCVNDQAVKMILKCFSTPPPRQGQPIPENKIIRSIFECYKTSQEHIYQNETMLQHSRKKFCKLPTNNSSPDQSSDNHSDYGSHSRSTCHHSQSTGGGSGGGSGGDEDDVVMEAIELLIQLTLPFYRTNQGLDYYTLIGRFSIDSLVKYLTDIIKSPTTSRKMVCLSLTALANISFITTEPIKVHGTNRVMLEMFRTIRSRAKDLELRDHAVTILANTAEKNLLDIVNNAGLTFLLSCLESCPNRMANYKQLDRSRRVVYDLPSDDGYHRLNIENKPRDRKPIDFGSCQSFPIDVLECACDQMESQHRLGNTSPTSASYLYQQQQKPSLCIQNLSMEELATMERIHQKTAVAFARMSSDPSTTRMVLKYGGIKQMIDLCKFSHKRNHSDTVLIACIAALRKMSKVIESETFKYYNALDLIELDLNQALEIYGSSQRIDRQLVSDSRQRLFSSEV